VVSASLVTSPEPSENRERNAEDGECDANTD
jgi:hypothetical protein